MEVQQQDSAKLLQSAQLIESNGQHLTYIRNMSVFKYKQQCQSLRTLENFMESYQPQGKIKLNQQALNILVIELGYFLFTCRSFGIKPSIEASQIKIEEQYVRSNEKKFTVVIFYKLEEKDMEDMEAATLFGGIIEHLETNLAPIIQNRQSPQAQYEAAYDVFREQYKALTASSIFQCKEVAVFQALEQTNLFYQYSMLFRVKNCSILDFIRGDPQKLKIFKQFKNRDEQLLQEYNQEKKKFRGQNSQMLKAKQKEANINILKFFESIHEMFKVVPSPENEKDQTIRFNFGLKQKSKIPFETFLRRLQQNEEQMAEQIKVDIKRQPAQLNFYVEYSSQRNTICVRLLMPHLMVNMDTSDFLMFQSNVLTFQAVNVSIQLGDHRGPKPQNSNKQAPKIVTFKGTSSFNIKEPPLEKILLLMDITMIASRIYEPELNPQKCNAPKDSYNRMSTLARKVSHYTKFLMRCAKRAYSE